MKPILSISIFSALLLASCANNGNKYAELTSKIDSLQNDIETLKQQLAKPEIKDTTQNFSSIPNQVAAIETTAQTKIIQPKQVRDTLHKKVLKPSPEPKEKPISKTSINFNQGKIYYYKLTPTQKSVEITAWQDGKRKVYFFNPSGDTTYTIEDIRQSYSYTTELVKFHSSGACALAKISINPGASMYWYETEITFDENGNPQWKREMQFPQTSTYQSLNNSSWWNIKTKSWVKQEIVKEQEVPH